MRCQRVWDSPHGEILLWAYVVLWTRRVSTAFFVGEVPAVSTGSPPRWKLIPIDTWQPPRLANAITLRCGISSTCPVPLSRVSMAPTDLNSLSVVSVGVSCCKPSVWHNRTLITRSMSLDRERSTPSNDDCSFDEADIDYSIRDSSHTQAALRWYCFVKHCFREMWRLSLTIVPESAIVRVVAERHLSQSARCESRLYEYVPRTSGHYRVSQSVCQPRSGREVATACSLAISGWQTGRFQ